MMTATFGLFLLFYCINIALGVEEENIALNQQSWQSGTWSGPAESFRSFDGDTNPAYSGQSCSHTQQVNNPWLAVDLQYSRLVYRVDVTNRVQYAFRLTKVRLGTSDTSPAIVAPALTNFDVCHSFEGSVAAGATISFYCGSMGRYLILQLQQDNMILNVCEVKVYGERSSMWMIPVAGQHLTGHSLSVAATEGSSVRRCAQRCVHNAACSSFNYRATSSSCELVSSTFNEEATSGIADEEWTWYKRPSLY